jgi:FkbM family methyltransferase
MPRIARLIEHIQKGTLLQRIRRRKVYWWESQKGKPGYVDAKIQQGIRMRLHFESELARLIFCDDFERTERDFLNAFLKPGDVFVDVGANIGIFSLIAARRVGKKGRVYAFEPTPETFSRLQDNVKLNRFLNIQCFEQALSDEAGAFRFFISEDGFDAWNSLAQPTRGKPIGTIVTKSDTLDHFVRERNLAGKLAMIKIDVEGWEARVLVGGHETLSRDDAPLLQVEFTDEAAASAGSSCLELYHTLQGLGYELFSYDPEKSRLIEEPLREQYPYANLIASKSKQDVAKRLKQQDPISLFRKR